MAKQFTFVPTQTKPPKPASSFPTHPGCQICREARSHLWLPPDGNREITSMATPWKRPKHLAFLKSFTAARGGLKPVSWQTLQTGTKLTKPDWNKGVGSWFMVHPVIELKF